MSGPAIFGMVVCALALIGAIRVVRFTIATARAIPGALVRGLASIGRGLAKLEPKEVP